MGDCDKTLHELQTYLDGELDPAIQEFVDTHLNTCTDCLQAFDFHAEFKQVVRQKCRSDELPASLVAKIEQCWREDLDGDGLIG